MSAKVMLTVIQGKLKGNIFTFDKRKTCIVGRSTECDLQLPDDEAHRKTSRHHCLFDINPPDIRVRDLGSLNGTFVNGKRIGQRKLEQTAKQASENIFPEYDLKDGDEVKLGNTVFRISIYVPVQEKHDEPQSKHRTCAMCRKDVSKEVGSSQQGDYICASCRKNPFKVMEWLLRLADTGRRELVAIQGYTILREIGKGGMGAVYVVQHEKTRKQVALKVMLPQVAANEISEKKFLREIALTENLRHPNLVQLYDHGCSEGTFFFTLELCDGGNVDHLMSKYGGKLPINEAMGIMLQLLDGLEYAHNVEIPNVERTDGRIVTIHGLVHRDIKPSNFLLSGSGNQRVVKIADYGLAKAFDTAGLSGLTMTGEVLGTPPFMPRQQVINFRFAKPEVDIWAMAASLYNMLTGKFPRDFRRGKDPWAIVLKERAVPIRKRDPSVPKKLAEVVDEALIDKPDITFKTATEFKQALEGVL